MSAKFRAVEEPGAVVPLPAIHFTLKLVEGGPQLSANGVMICWIDKDDGKLWVNTASRETVPGLSYNRSGDGISTANAEK